jgi:hypothetical protein
MRRLEVTGEGWRYTPVLWAESRYERWRGLRGRPDEAALLIATCSVHGLGLSRPFRAIGLTDGGLVQRIRTVDPGRVALLRGCRYILELPLDVTPPRVGTRLMVRHV